MKQLLCSLPLLKADCCRKQEQKQLQAEAQEGPTSLSAELEGAKATAARLQQECSSQADELRHQLQQQQTATVQVRPAAESMHMCNSLNAWTHTVPCAQATVQVSIAVSTAVDCVI